MRDFEDFSRQFETKFKAQFNCGPKNQKEFDAMMREFEKTLETEVHARVTADVNAEVFAQVSKNLEIQEEAMARSREHHAEAMAAHQEALARMNEELARMEEEQARSMKEMEKNLKRMEDNLKKFEAELQKELVKDGYLKTNEKIENINWDNNHEMKVNGKAIREEHKKKYRQLHDKYFDDKDLAPERD